MHKSSTKPKENG